MHQFGRPPQRVGAAVCWPEMCNNPPGIRSDYPSVNAIHVELAAISQPFAAIAAIEPGSRTASNGQKTIQLCLPEAINDVTRAYSGSHFMTMLGSTCNYSYQVPS